MMATWRDDYRSWGDALKARHLVARPRDRAQAARVLSSLRDRPVLGFGCGASYGDVGLNPEGGLIDCREMDRFLSFDPVTGVLSCEAGVRFADILAVICRPDADGSGWLLPVTPGTRFISVAGAIANDVHGKNHHEAGTFGRHVLALELLRGDGRRLACSPTENAELFAATIGGLGLTGLILSATIQMRRVAGLAVTAEDIQFGNLADFFALAEESEGAWEYTAAWVDCLAAGRTLGRGIFSRARHAPGRPSPPPARSPRHKMPFSPPMSLANSLSVRAFNALYWRKLGPSGRSLAVRSYEPVFYPLDILGEWNKIYGNKGFYQFQGVVPAASAAAASAEMLRGIAASGQGSMLTVMKRFGTSVSPGLLSFPMPGTTLSLDFPNRGAETHALLDRLETIVVEAGGRIYPSKDGRMSERAFTMGYPNRDRFRRQIDPRFSSSLARRVGLVAATK
jgi:FAD/FMN-containing dehydrogenase